MFPPMVPKLSLDIFCVPCTFGVVPFFWNKKLFRKNLAPRNLSGINLGTTPRRHHTWGFDRKPARFPQPMGKRWGNLCQSDSAISSCDLIIHNWTTRQLGTCPCIGTVSSGWIDLVTGYIWGPSSGWFIKKHDIQQAARLTQQDSKMMTDYDTDIDVEFFWNPSWPTSKAMNVFFGPLCDVAGYAFATAAVIAPFSGFNIVTGCFVKTNRGRVANTVNYLATKVLSDHANCLGLFGYKQTCWIFHHWTCV